MRQSYTDALSKAEHYVALEQTTVYLDEDDDGLPWDKVSGIEAGAGHRLNGPTSFYCIVRHAGLEFKWSVDFESRDANGKSYSLFDRPRLREVVLKLPVSARRQLADFLDREVLPGVQKTSAEWREIMNRQIDSEDCVRGLIYFASNE